MIALVGTFNKQETGDGPGWGLLPECETSNFAKIRFQFNQHRTYLLSAYSFLRCPLLFQINLTSVTMAGDDEELSLLLSTISSQPVTQEDINSLLFSLPTTTAPSMISYGGYEQFETELGPHNIADTDMVSPILTPDLYPVLPVPVPEVPRVRNVSVCVSR